MILIDTHAYNSKIRHLDPVQKITFTATTMGVCLLANHFIVSLLVIMSTVFLIVNKVGTPVRYFVKLLALPMTFLTLGIAPIMMSVSTNKVSYSFSFLGLWVGFSKFGLIFAANLYAKTIGSVLCMYFLSLSTPMVDLLVALKRLRLPKLMVEIMELVYRFIFIFFDTASTIYTSQNCRCGYVDIVSKFKSIGSLISIVFIRAFKRSDDLYTALEVRGFNGDFNVISNDYEDNWKGYIFTFTFNIALLILAVGIR